MRESIYKGIATNSYTVEWGRDGYVETLSRSEAKFLKNKLAMGHVMAKCRMINCSTGECVKEITA